MAVVRGIAVRVVLVRVSGVVTSPPTVTDWAFVGVWRKRRTAARRRTLIWIYFL
jgi:hypothetical protein